MIVRRGCLRESGMRIVGKGGGLAHGPGPLGDSDVWAKHVVAACSRITRLFRKKNERVSQFLLENN